MEFLSWILVEIFAPVADLGDYTFGNISMNINRDSYGSDKTLISWETAIYNFKKKATILNYLLGNYHAAGTNMYV